MSCMEENRYIAMLDLLFKAFKDTCAIFNRTITLLRDIVA